MADGDVRAPRRAILTLYAAGLQSGNISALDRRDLSAAGGVLHIGGRHHLHSQVTEPGPHIDGAAVWHNWEQVLQVVDGHPSTRTLEHHLRTDVFPDSHEFVRGAGAGPLVVPIDRWGAMLLPPGAMTPAAVAQIVTAHLTGSAAQHRPRPVHPSAGGRAAGHGSVSPALSDPRPARSDVRLDDTHAVGVAARRAAHIALADVGGVFDDIEDRADELLRRTLALLDDTG